MEEDIMDKIDGVIRGMSVGQSVNLGDALREKKHSRNDVCGKGQKRARC